MGGSCDGCHGRASSGVSDEIEHDIGIDSIDVMVCVLIGQTVVVGSE